MIAALALLVAAPAEVDAFAERFRGCVHWFIQEPDSADRVSEIQQAVADLRCDRLDREEASLRRRYRDKPEAIAKLDELRRVD